MCSHHTVYLGTFKTCVQSAGSAVCVGGACMLWHPPVGVSIVRIHTKYPRARSRSAAALGVVRTVSQILIMTVMIRKGKGLKPYKNFIRQIVSDLN